MARWYVISSVKNGWYQFWKDSHQIPASIWRRWASTLALGLGICAVIMFLITVIAKGQVEQGLQRWDESLLPGLAEQLPLTFARAITWESPGNLLGMLPVVGVFVGITIARSQPLLTATMIAAYGLQFALVWIGWGYWNRDRPDLIADGVAASGLHSFPSGHTVVVITVYGLLSYLLCMASRSWLERCLIITATAYWLFLIICSRVVLGAHWPSDVLVATIIGLLWLVVVIVTLHRVRDGWQRKP